MQDAGARRVSNAGGMRRIVRKHDCALPAQYTKHSNARGHSLVGVRKPTKRAISIYTQIYAQAFNVALLAVPALFVLVLLGLELAPTQKLGSSFLWLL